MTLRTLSNINEKILIVGSIYDQLDKVEKISTIISNYSTVIFNGNLLYPFSDINQIKNRIQIMNELLKTQKVIYNLGEYDLKLFNILNKSDKHFDVQKWIMSKPNVIAIDFSNTSSVLVMSGGITPKICNRHMLNDNLEVSFVSYFNDKPWQIYYSGLMGYIISNNPSSNKPTFYPYAEQIGAKYSDKFNVYAQEIDPSGLKDIITL
jgi:hypothetical protein